MANNKTIATKVSYAFKHQVVDTSASAHVNSRALKAVEVDFSELYRRLNEKSDSLKTTKMTGKINKGIYDFFKTVLDYLCG